MKKLCILVFFVCLLLCVGCTSKYLGRPIHYNNKAVCKCSSLPQSCYNAFEHLVINYTISKGRVPNEYIFSGTATWVDNGAFPTAKNCIGHIDLFLGKGVIVDSIPLGLQLNVGQAKKFRHIFKTEHDFNCVLLGYNLRVKEI